MVMDEAGSLPGVARHDYLPFGEELSAGAGGRTATQGYGAADNIRQKFTKKERDAETNLDFFEARYYSSAIGRFTSPDEFQGGPLEVFVLGTGHPQKQALPYAEIANPQTLNKYQYCLNNPLRYVDPDGHQGQEGNADTGIIDRLITSAQEVLGSLFGSLQRAIGDNAAPEEEKRPGPLGNKDQVIEGYMAEQGRRLEFATDLMLKADVTGIGGIYVAGARGDTKGAVTDAAMTMITIMVPGGKGARGPVTAAIKKLGLPITSSKGGIISVTGTASDAGKLFNILRGGNKVAVRQGSMGGTIYTAKSATSNTIVTLRPASQSVSKILTVDVHGVEGTIRKVKIQ
jgi:RHS repeat-associated protein